VLHVDGLLAAELGKLGLQTRHPKSGQNVPVFGLDLMFFKKETPFHHLLLNRPPVRLGQGRVFVEHVLQEPFAYLQRRLQNLVAVSTRLGAVENELGEGRDKQIECAVTHLDNLI